MQLFINQFEEAFVINLNRCTFIIWDWVHMRTASNDCPILMLIFLKSLSIFEWNENDLFSLVILRNIGF